VIGAAVLVVGLLLILAGLLGARIPGGASFAPSGIGRSAAVDGEDDGGPFAFLRRAENPVRAFVLSPIHPATWSATAAILIGPVVAFVGLAVVASIGSIGFTTLVVGVGIVFLGFAFEAARVVARVERRRVFAGTGLRPAPHSYKPLRGGIVDLLRAEFADESRWRDLLYVAIDVPLSVIELAAVAIAWSLSLWFLTMPIWHDTIGAPLPAFLGPIAGDEPLLVTVRTLAGLVLLPVAASVSQLVIALHRAVVTGLLCTSDSRELRRQVEVLRESRSAILESEASELHRIERDLHDGAQQRLVALTIDLGLASERLDSDPAEARRLVLEGQSQARQALAEIRDLVRGIAPSILLDRGLVPALESIAGPGPIPTSIRSELAAGERLPASVERAAYFVATEALTNVAKHSAATRGEVRVRREGGNLVVEVRDDGHGGAEIMPGGGLDGLQKRVAGVDGSLIVASPAGGPTVVRAEIPMGAGAVST
jgi:signal transduction histidine kinase